MSGTIDQRPGALNEAGPKPAEPAPAEGKQVPPVAPPGQPSAPATSPPGESPPPPEAKPPSHPARKWLLWGGGGAVVLTAAAYFLVPKVVTMLKTVSTDDAYVNGHVTFVAPRVAGQVSRVLVDDNMRVKKGDLLVQIDKEPYQVQVAIKKAVVVGAQTDLAAAKSQVRGLEALARSQRWQTEAAVEQVDNQVALIKAKVAAHASMEATQKRAQADLVRARRVSGSNAMSREDFDQRQQAAGVAEAQVKQALEEIHQVRVSLGLPPVPANGDLTKVPPDINQTYSGVRTALAKMIQTMAQLGLPLTNADATPNMVLEEFRKRDADGDVDRILAKLVPNAPAVKQADAKLLQARRDLEQAELNLRYCDVVSEIDGVVTRRNVNPGNNVLAGQSLMAVRSLTEIWIDANFKETQLADLRIGQRVRVEVDMYGGRREYEGRITGFTMGTGQTLALLPPQNATGNFVKIVQRLPVRIELTDYDPDSNPLFLGLSVTPYVYFKETPTGPQAGDVLQSLRPLPQRPTAPTP